MKALIVITKDFAEEIYLETGEVGEIFRLLEINGLECTANENFDVPVGFCDEPVYDLTFGDPDLDVIGYSLPVSCLRPIK